LTKPAANHRPTVCLFSFHPLLLSEFERLLAGENEAKVIDRRVEPNQPPDGTVSVPRANVYVIEAHSHRPVTEAWVATVLEHVPRARLVVIAETLSVADGGFWVPRSLLSAFVDSTLETVRRPRPAPPGVRMSRRETEVVELLMQNLSNKEIGSKLHMSERTAKFHVSNLLAKYGVQRRADLILLFVQAERIAAAP
jgi:DNA-binding NarL/FixJ family response regulator